MSDLNELSVAALRALAKEKGLKGVSSLRKTELIKLLAETEAKEQSDSVLKKESDTANNTQINANVKEQPEADNQTVKRISTPTKMTSRTFEQTETDHDHKEESAEVMEQVQNNTFEKNTNSIRQNNNRRQNNNHQNREEYLERRQNNNRANSGEQQYNERRQNYNRQNNPRQNNDGQQNAEHYQNNNNRFQNNNRRASMSQERMDSLDSGEVARGILDINLEGGYGFIRGENYLTCENDIYVANTQIRRFNLKTGDYLEGPIRISQGNEKFQALLYISKINGEDPENARKRVPFEKLVPIFANERLKLETPGCSNAMRIMNLFAPIGKGQRGMIVSPPKAGKTTLLKDVANAVKTNHPEVHIIILLIDERPEEVTDIKESIQGDNVEVIHSTFDELPSHHVHVAEMVLDRGRRLVEQGQDCMILLDSITRLTRAYNLTIQASGRTLSGGLDPAALHKPKKFFGAARNIRDGGSLTILATALVDTGSRMDDVVFEEFKGTGNMEIVLDRKMSERRIFPAIDLLKSGTRRDDLLLNEAEQEAMTNVRRQLVTLNPEEITEHILQVMEKTRNNTEFVEMLRKLKTKTPASKNVATVIRDQNRTLTK